MRLRFLLPCLALVLGAAVLLAPAPAPAQDPVLPHEPPRDLRPQELITPIATTAIPIDDLLRKRGVPVEAPPAPDATATAIPVVPRGPLPEPVDPLLRNRPCPDGPPLRGAVLFIADGLSPAAIALARQVLVGRDHALAIDRFPVTARLITTPADGPVTDSAAAATAFACGEPTGDGRLGVDAQGQVLASLWEVARDQGWRTGLITDTNITHATPAGFNCHSAARSEEPLAPQVLASRFTLLFGGGRRFWRGKGAGGERADGRDLLAAAREQGYRVLGSRADLLAWRPDQPEPLLGLFADDFLPPTWDAADAQTPTLAELTGVALRRLDDGKSPFLLMVEAGKIDAMLHAHDAAELVAQLARMEDAVRLLLDHVAARPDTLFLFAGDHSTGGLHLSDRFDVEAFRRLATSTKALARRLTAGPAPLAQQLQSLLLQPALMATETAELLAAAGGRNFEEHLGNVVARRFGLTFLDADWQASLRHTGHSGEDIFLHAAGRHQALFGGVLRTAEVARRLAAAAGLTLPGPASGPALTPPPGPAAPHHPAGY